MKTIKTMRDEIEAQPFFAGLAPRYLDLLTGCAFNEYFLDGAYLFREQEPADRFYVLRYGRVALETYVPQRGPLTIETIEAGDVLGWSWLFPPYRWHFSGRVVEPVHAIAFDGACLREKCECDHDLGYELMRQFARVMMDRLQATRLQLTDMYAVTAPAKRGGL
jgi:CRP/FNR family transcriptional regulator, cyclic AMP receptor protein